MGIWHFKGKDFVSPPPPLVALISRHKEVTYGEKKKKWQERTRSRLRVFLLVPHKQHRTDNILYAQNKGGSAPERLWSAVWHHLCAMTFVITDNDA